MTRQSSSSAPSAGSAAMSTSRSVWPSPRRSRTSALPSSSACSAMTCALQRRASAPHRRRSNVIASSSGCSSSQAWTPRPPRRRPAAWSTACQRTPTDVSRPISGADELPLVYLLVAQSPLSIGRVPTNGYHLPVCTWDNGLKKPAQSHSQNTQHQTRQKRRTTDAGPWTTAPRKRSIPTTTEQLQLLGRRPHGRLLLFRDLAAC